jgi:hypothetical protein
MKVDNAQGKAMNPDPKIKKQPNPEEDAFLSRLMHIRCFRLSALLFSRK